MEANYTVALSKIIEEFDLESVYLNDLPEHIKITTSRVNRPGLQLVGFYDHYEQARLQIIGKVEHLFISQLDPEERKTRLDDFFRSGPAGIIFTTSIDIDKQIVELAEKHGYDLLGKIPMDPKLSALVDKGWIEMMDNDYLESAAEVLVNRTTKKM